MSAAIISHSNQKRKTNQPVDEEKISLDKLISNTNKSLQEIKEGQVMAQKANFEEKGCDNTKIGCLIEELEGYEEHEAKKSKKGNAFMGSGKFLNYIIRHKKASVGSHKKQKSEAQKKSNESKNPNKSKLAVS